MTDESPEIAQSENVATSSSLTRRQFLKGSGAIAAIYTGKKLLDQAPLLKATYDAYTAREDYAAPNTELFKKEELDWEWRQKLYQKHFGEEEKDGKYWIDRESFTMHDFTDVFGDFQEKAMVYYETEKHPGESFVDFVERYYDQAFDMSQSVGLDFGAYLMFSGRALQVSNSASLQDDIDISRKQLLAGAAERLLGTEGKLIASVTAQKSARSPLDRLRYRVSKEAHDKLPLPVRQGARIDGPLTLGAFDLETINFALATAGNPAASDQLAQSYPDVAEHFTQLKANYDVLQAHKAEAVSLIETLYPELQPLIEVFLTENNRDHLDAIGIGDDTIDDWHRTHASIPFVHYMIDGDLKGAATNTRLFYQGKFDKDMPDPNERGKILLRDELLNPKFLPYLRQHGLLKGGSFSGSLGQLEEMAVKLKDAEQLAVVSERLADASIGPLEINSHYQLLTTAAHLRRLQETVETHDGKPTDLSERNSFAYLIYRMRAMTDWPPHFIQTGRFNTLPATKADPWDTTAPVVLDNFERVLQKAAELGYPLTPEQDLENFLFQMNAFDPSSPNPFALPLDARNGLAHEIWLRTLTPPAQSWDWAAGQVKDYVRDPYITDLPYFTSDQRDQIRSETIRNIINEPVPGTQSQLETIFRYVEETTAPGSTVEILIQTEEGYHIDRPITLPKDRHVILRGNRGGGYGGTITVGAGVDRAFVTHKDSGPCNVWIAGLDVEVDQPNSRTPLTLVDFDGKGSGNLFVKDLRVIEEKGKHPINSGIKVSNATAFFAEGCSYSGSKPIVLDKVQYALIQSCLLKAVGKDAVAVTSTHVTIPSSGEIDNFAPLQINYTGLEGFAFAASTDSPQVNVVGGSLEVENLVNSRGTSQRPVVKLIGTVLDSAPLYQGGFDLHLNGTSTVVDQDADETLARLSQIAKYDQKSVFTTSGNDVLLPWSFSAEQEKKYKDLVDGPLFTVEPAKEAPHRIFMPTSSKQR